MLNLTQAAVYNTIKRGNSACWISDRAEGKTFVALRLLEEMGGVIIVGDTFKATEVKKTWPSFQVATYKSIDAGRGWSDANVVVYDDFPDYDYYAQQQMLYNVVHRPTLWLASHWSQTSVKSATYNMILEHLKANDVRLFIT